MNKIDYFYQNDLIVGHRREFEAVMTSFLSSKSSSFLFYGPKGIGKSLIANYLSSIILNEKIQYEENKAIFFHKDLFILKASEEEVNKSGLIKLDQIRKMKNFFVKSSSSDGWRVAIVNDLDDISFENMNALLKIIEEPPKKSLIILISSNYWRIPLTIKSRCALFRFKNLSSNETEKTIFMNFNKTEKNLPLKYISHICDGSPGKAINILNLNVYELFKETCLKLSNDFDEIEMMRISEEWTKIIKTNHEAINLFQHIFEIVFKLLLEYSINKNNQKNKVFLEIDFLKNLVDSLSLKLDPIKISFLYKSFIEDFNKSKILYLDFTDTVYNLFYKFKCNNNIIN